VHEVHSHFAAYRFDLAAQALYEFTWNDYCDWFLELAKPALAGDDATAANSTRHTLLYVLETTLRLLHPLIPFITEEIWHAIAPKLGIPGDTISLQEYPTPEERDYDASRADIEWLKAVVSQLRRIRSEMNIPPGKSIPLILQGGNTEDRDRMRRHDAALKFLARLDSVVWLDGEAPPAAAAVVGELKLLVPLAGLIDLSAEKARLAKEIKRVEAEIGKCRGKLDSETFANNAPAAVVEQEHRRLSEWSGQLAILQEQHRRL
jgi:valyl-tRNA synthetase